jgi:hypothetical protein
MDLLRAQGNTRQQALSQVSEIPVRVAGGGNSLVYLEQLHCLPRDFFTGEMLQHQPRRVPAAHGKDKTTTRDNRISSLSCDDGGRLAGDRSDVGKDLNVLENASIP